MVVVVNLVAKTTAMAAAGEANSAVLEACLVRNPFRPSRSRDEAREAVA